MPNAISCRSEHWTGKNKIYFIKYVIIDKLNVVSSYKSGDLQQPQPVINRFHLMQWLRNPNDFHFHQQQKVLSLIVSSSIKVLIFPILLSVFH